MYSLDSLIYFLFSTTASYLGVGGFGEAALASFSVADPNHTL
jgi:hypothetical protein